jgi:hypothetical protein
MWTIPCERRPQLLELIAAYDGRRRVVRLRSPGERHRFMEQFNDAAT